MSQSVNPYKQQPSKAFWRKTVSDNHFLEIPDWYQKKWSISDFKIATAGSCFAQHIGRNLRHSGFKFLDVEPAPPFLRQEHWETFGYNVYSARYGNVYTARQLLQLVKRAFGDFEPVDQCWSHEGGFVDPFRPSVEPPLRSPEEVEFSRNCHLAAVRRLIETTDLFVFTLGLTEAWFSAVDGAVYPICPGTQGGAFDASVHKFINFNFSEVC